MGPVYRDATEVTSAEVSRNFGAWQDRAMNGPVIVTRHGRPRVVILSAADYAATEQRQSFLGDAAGQSHVEIARAAILNHTTQGFASFDAELRFLSVNRVYEDLTTSSAAQLVGRRFEECFPTASPVLVDQLRRTLRTGEAAEFETRSAVFPDRFYRAQTFPYPGGMAVLINSRAEDRERETFLTETAAIRTAIEATVPVAIGTLNVRGVFVHVNASFRDLTGFSTDDLAGIRFTDLVRPAQRHAVLQAIEDTLRSGTVTTFDTIILAKGSTERSVKIGLAPISREDVYEGLAVVAIAAPA